MADIYDGKVALVTGASSGLGVGIAELLARKGAAVVLVARRKELLDQVEARINSAGGKAFAIPCDVTDENNLKALLSGFKERFDHLDLLVNNAGKGLMLPLQVTPLAEIRSLLDLNVSSVALVTKCFIGLLKSGSAIVNMSSALGFQGTPAMSIYSASKGAVIAMTRALAKELAPRGIRVNAVAPGMVRTELLEKMLARLKPEQAEALEKRHPLGFGRLEDVAEAVSFLGSPASRWITGQTIVVDGGLTC